MGVALLVVIFKVTETDVTAVGETELEGVNSQAAPVGRPPGQLKTTISSNGPYADTTNSIGLETSPCATLTVDGFNPLTA